MTRNDSPILGTLTLWGAGLCGALLLLLQACTLPKQVPLTERVPALSQEEAARCTFLGEVTGRHHSPRVAYAAARRGVLADGGNAMRRVSAATETNYNGLQIVVTVNALRCGTDAG